MSNKKQNYKKHLINDDIKFDIVRISGEDEITDMKQVREIANEQGLDIMLVTDKTTPPIVKICDYNKYLYKQKKTQKDLLSKQKKNTKGSKEIRLTPNISSGDLIVKVNKIKEFIEKGHSVKLSMKFKGRTIVYKNTGQEVLLKIAVDLENIAKVNELPKMVGKSMNMTLNPK